MQIILFGGSFDPPHLGHKAAAENVITQHIADEVWFVPCQDHPFDKKLSDAAHRYAMLELMSKYIPNTKVSDYELKKKSKSYSLETLQHFSKTQPQHTFAWMIGSDQLESFSKWFHYEVLLQLFKVYVYPRANFPFAPLLPNMIPLTTMPEVAISSTQIREAIQDNTTIQKFVTPEVLTYIQQHNLYQKV